MDEQRDRPGRRARFTKIVAVGAVLALAVAWAGASDADLLGVLGDEPSGDVTTAADPDVAGTLPTTAPSAPASGDDGPDADAPARTATGPSTSERLAALGQERRVIAGRRGAARPPVPDIVRGVYSHVYSFWGGNWSNLVRLVEETELNAVVVDVKDEAGTLLWDIDHPLAEAGGGADWRKDFDGVEDRLQMLKDAGGWAIARIACFKDTLVADARPDLAVQNPSGRTWKARKDFSWLNPYQDAAGQWCIDVGLAALELGFDEIQFDYIRFPNGGDGDTSVISLPGVPPDRPREEWRHSDEIIDFLATASDQIHASGGYVSADLFGLVTYDFRWDAGGTGQVLERIAEHVDFISPMVYPSHYSTGNYGLLPHPIEHPYETVWNAMQEAQMRVQGLHAQMRPWLEDFSAPWMGYPDHSPGHVQEQLRATYENGIDGWMLWNAANRYTESILDRGEAVSKRNDDFRPPARTANPDPAPGAPERQWPGMPPCDPYPGILQVGEGNLAGSTPPELALPFDDERLCAGVPDGEEAEATWRERAASPSEPTSEPTSGPTSEPASESTSGSASGA